MSLKTIVLVLFFAALLSCNKDKSAGNGAIATTETHSQTNNTGYGGVIAGQLVLSAGAPESSIANATVIAEGKPEIQAKTDEKGAFKVENVLPGTLNMYVLSEDGAALTAGSGSQYGVKLADVVVRDKETTDVGEHEFKKTGSVKGKVEFHKNPNDLDVAGTDVYVPGVTGMLVKTDDQGLFTLTGLPSGTYTIHVFHTGFATAKIADVKVESEETTDLGDISLSLSTGPEGGIAVAADLTKEVGGETKKISTSRTVSINLNYDRDTALMKIADEPSFLNREWIPAAKTSTWTFTSDGPKRLYVMYSDLNGLESSPFADDIIVDTEAPTLNSAAILNNWGTTAASLNPVTLDASDTGTGVAEVRFSLTDNAFSDNLAWQPFSSTVNVSIGSSAGSKTVYVKVRDYAGRESTVAQDSITKDSYSEITVGTYNDNVTLYKAQSPYKITGSTTFEKNLTLEPGVRVYAPIMGSLKVKGVLTAVGTNHTPGDGQIVFEGASSGGDTCRLELDFKATPGVSEKHKVSYAEFKSVEMVRANGGQYNNNRFINTACGGPTGSFVKTGQDPLALIGSHFDDWGTGLSTSEGNGASQIKNSTGNVRQILNQEGTADNSVVSGNNVLLNGNSAFIKIANGTVTNSNNIVGGTGAGTFSVIEKSSNSVVSLTGLTVTGCETIVDTSFSTGGSLTITESTFTNCRSGIYGSHASTPINFIRNNITFNESAVSSSGAIKGTINFERNYLKFDNQGNASNYADIVFMGNTGADADFDVILRNNNIDCQDALGCRGAIVSICGSGLCPIGVTVVLDQNYYSDKSQSADIADTSACGATKVVCSEYADYAGAGNRVNNASIQISEYFAGHNGTNPQAVWTVSTTGISASANSAGRTP